MYLFSKNTSSKTPIFVKLQAVSLLQAPLPYKANSTELPLGRGENYDRSCYYNGPSLCVCDYDHHYPEEEERLTTKTGETTVLGEGNHYDSMTRKTAMVTTMQDRLKLLAFFSHGSRAGTTTKGDTMTTRVADASCNGSDYNNCDVSTTAASTDGSDTESTTSADTDRPPSSTLPTVDNDVDLINPLPASCTHYILMMPAAKGPAGPPGAPPPAPPGLIPPQARLPQPTVFDGTIAPFKSGYT